MVAIGPLAQLVEHLTFNQVVPRSSRGWITKYGRVPEWPKGTDCKSVSFAFGGSNPPPSTTKIHPLRVFFLLPFLLFERRYRFDFFVALCPFVAGACFRQAPAAVPKCCFVYRICLKNALVCGIIFIKELY